MDMKTPIRQAVILAGGKGERLLPLTRTVPKPMAPVYGRPFLEYLITRLRDEGITDIVLLIGYLGEKIKSHFGDGTRFGVHIAYSNGSPEDQTGKRIYDARHALHDTFFLLYGDNYWPFILSRISAEYVRIGAPVLMSVYANTDGAGEYGNENNVALRSDGLVSVYDKMRKDKRAHAIDIGCFVLTRDMCEGMPSGNISFEEDILPPLVAQGKVAAYSTEHHYYTITNHDRLLVAEKFFTPKKSVILDRDGVINKKPREGDYVKRWSEFEFLPDALDAMRMLTRKGYDIFIATNQRGVARGYMAEKDVDDIHARMRDVCDKEGISVRGIYACFHNDTDNCGCRKPKPGMLLQAAHDHFFDITKAIFIGDDIRDEQAGNAAGCKTFLLNGQKDLLSIASALS